MKNLIEFIKTNGATKGGIIEGTNGYFTAVGGAFSKDYKTLKGAEKYMNKMGYERA